ncbi:M15 family metallopeptidase [Candidatus Kaiserbacteria bacterium]|nr:M15 family metallopeptidase [Candidatus Kaiserbacteria bacterium]
MALFRSYIRPVVLLSILLGLALVAAGYGTYRQYRSIQELTYTIDVRDTELHGAHDENKRLAEAVESLTKERDTLSEALHAEKEKNESFAGQIEKITGTVGKLDKLSKTDPELLKKYSKVYFLNEHYTPQKLVLLEKAYGYDESKEFYLAREIVPFFEDMIAEAKEDDIDLWVVSAYRSFETQQGLKSAYSVTYGSGANTFSADQGYSEHQLGTTIDFTTKNLDGGLSGFDTTPAYEWLKGNAHKYGFVLSYPEDNTYYIFEPWHWRFVGTDLAKDLHEDEQYFYDLDQRTLDEYLISIFD